MHAIYGWKSLYLYYLVCLLELMFMEASAMTGDGVEDIFLKCARSILTKVETGKTIMSAD